MEYRTVQFTVKNINKLYIFLYEEEIIKYDDMYKSLTEISFEDGK